MLLNYFAIGKLSDICNTPDLTLTSMISQLFRMLRESQFMLLVLIPILFSYLQIRSPSEITYYF